ncbi:MAG: hypothetical protein DRQ78_10580, partial [Epsilonproteobacteria bacterium]
YKAVPVLVVGESGTGKSTMIRTLPPKKTVILNTEIKAMPFKNHDDFKVVDINTYKTLDAALRYYLSDKGDKFDYLVLDSFTSMTEIIDKYTSAVYQGFDQWKNYNLLIYDMINRIKQLKQQVFVMGIPEQKAEGFNEIKKYIRIKGKELKYGDIEKEFTIVLYTNPIYDEDTGEMENVEMLFKPDKRNTAKAPMGMFNNRPKNSALEVSNIINNFYIEERTNNEEKLEKGNK